MKTTIQGVEIPQQVIDELMNLFKQWSDHCIKQMPYLNYF